ncbi:MAG: poly(3-hydroxybutyrate) depolymerase [Paraglaciecola sp.]|jgi:poly(3-hydroxybutyrate) depolymerase
MNSLSKLFFFLLVVFTLGACGGGGGVSVTQPPPPVALELAITSPNNGEEMTTNGFTISGTSRNATSVTISIDNTTEITTTGTNNWTLVVDPGTLSEGNHTIVAKATGAAGEIQSSIDIVVVFSFSVAFVSPSTGDELSTDTLTVSGTAENAESVTLSIDGGASTTANGTDNWNVIVEAGVLSVGSHTLVARAFRTGEVIATSIVITIVDSVTTGDTQSIVYNSSVDGTEMGARLYVPTNLDAAIDGPVPLFIHLHGGGGRGNLQATIVEQLESRRWIGISPDGREWGLADLGCPWGTSAAYVDNPDPNVGPGEQDIFDAIAWAAENYDIDPDRIYLTGFSMGGRGTYAIGLKNPDFFAAIAAMSPATDMFEIFARRPEPTECKAGMVGGNPGDSPFVDTMYKITSGRFLMENAYNLPVFHGHGLDDTVALNTATADSFQHGNHVLLDESWSECHGDTDLCFGHTPTLQELKQRHPEAYDWAYMFTSVEHQLDEKWVTGTVPSGVEEGVEDPQNPSRLLGSMDFFASHTRNNSPDTVVYKTFTDTHEKSFWLKLSSATPWLNQPAAVRATRNIEANSLALELSRTSELAIDLQLAQLDLLAPLDISISELQEPTFDPALMMDPNETLNPKIVLLGDFSNQQIEVSLDGQALDPELLMLSDDRVELGPIDVGQAVSLLVTTPLNYSCTQVIGFSQTLQWYNGGEIDNVSAFERAVDNDKWQLQAKAGATISSWADPESSVWSTAITSLCAEKSIQPDRIVLNISGEYGDVISAPIIPGDKTSGGWVENIEAALKELQRRHPEAHIVLQTVIGSPDESLQCTSPTNTLFLPEDEIINQGVGCNGFDLDTVNVRASEQYNFIYEASLLVVERNLLGINSLKMGVAPKVEACNYYCDKKGHIGIEESDSVSIDSLGTSGDLEFTGVDPRTEMGTLIGNFYSNN